eukprot:Pgem_evm1s9703
MITGKKKVSTPRSHATRIGGSALGRRLSLKKRSIIKELQIDMNTDVQPSRNRIDENNLIEKIAKIGDENENEGEDDCFSQNITKTNYKNKSDPNKKNKNKSKNKGRNKNKTKAKNRNESYNMDIDYNESESNYSTGFGISSCDTSEMEESHKEIESVNSMICPVC